MVISAVASATVALSVSTAVPSVATADTASVYLILDNDRNCRPDPEATWLLGQVTAQQLKKGRLQIRAEFVQGGGHEDMRYHVELAVHPNSTRCQAGDPKTITKSYFRTNGVAAGKKSFIIKDPQANFHVDVCNDSGDDCSFGGNFVYDSRQIRAADLSQAR